MAPGEQSRACALAVLIAGCGLSQPPRAWEGGVGWGGVGWVGGWVGGWVEQAKGGWGSLRLYAK
jgi:hypothetical protein